MKSRVNDLPKQGWSLTFNSTTRQTPEIPDSSRRTPAGVDGNLVVDREWQYAILTKDTLSGGVSPRSEVFCYLTLPEIATFERSDWHWGRGVWGGNVTCTNESQTWAKNQLKY
jgi:hypothetical protein